MKWVVYSFFSAIGVVEITRILYQVERRFFTSTRPAPPPPAPRPSAPLPERRREDATMRMVQATDGVWRRQ